MSTRGGKSGKKRERSTRTAGLRVRKNQKLSRAAIRKKVIEELKGVRKELDEMVEAGNAGDAVEKVWGLLVDSMSESSTVAYGKQSEKSDAAQLKDAIEHANDAKDDDGTLETPDLVVDKKPANPRKANRHNHGRKKLPKSLLTRVKVLPIPDVERACPSCGSQMAIIGYATSEVLEFVPAHFERVEYRREKCACGVCRDGGVVTAPEANKPYDSCLAGPGLLASIVVSKFSDHLPLTRLKRIYTRHGATIAVSTMAGWLERLLPVLEPLYDRMWELMLESYVIQHDATGLKVLDHTTDDNIRRGTIWCYVGEYKLVVFRYAPNGKGITGPWTWLKGIDCYLQSDAANVFNRLHNGKVANAANVGCWFHARRRFFKLIDKEPDAAKTVVLIRKLYAIEAKADATGLGPEARKALRQEESKPLLGRFRAWLDLSIRTVSTIR